MVLSVGPDRFEGRSDSGGKSGAVPVVGLFDNPAVVSHAPGAGPTAAECRAIVPRPGHRPADRPIAAVEQQVSIGDRSTGVLAAGNAANSAQAFVAMMDIGRIHV